MAKDDLLYKSIFTLFAGFLIFLASIMNNIYMFIGFVHEYFVLFIFIGAIITLLGIILAAMWHFHNLSPYYDPSTIAARPSKTHFTPFLAFGALLVIIGFIANFYYSALSRGVFVMSMIISISGIVMLVLGLNYFIREVILKKTQQHS